MPDILIRCSSLGRLMTEPKTKAEGVLSVGAKTYIRELAQQEIFSVEFEFSSKETEKGTEVEKDSIDLLNRVRGLSLVKNTERKSNGLITGEADLFDAQRRIGHDIKSSWSIKTFRGWPADAEDKSYEWQMRGYLWLWDADEWHVDYCLVDTPERLIGNYEPLPLHIVSHIPEHLRLTTWVIKRDKALEEKIAEKVEAAQAYYRAALWEFAEAHKDPQPAGLATGHESIRQEEAAKLRQEQEAKKKSEAEAEREADANRNGPSSIASQPPVHAGTDLFGNDALSQPASPTRGKYRMAGYTPPTAAELAATDIVDAEITSIEDDGSRIKLGQINSLIAPYFATTADGLSKLGFDHVDTDKNAKLYRECDVPAILTAAIRKLEEIRTQVQEQPSAMAA